MAISILMLQNSIFGIGLAVAGIPTPGLDLLHIILASILPEVSIVLTIMADTLCLPWFALLVFRLFKAQRRLIVSNNFRNAVFLHWGP